jgi:hypothetical protein
MNEKVAEILRQVRELSEAERAALIEALADVAFMHLHRRPGYWSARLS